VSVLPAARKTRTCACDRYWEMVASIVNRGLIDEDLFFRKQREQWGVWGTGEARHRRVARNVQQPEVLGQPRRNNGKVPRSLARSAQPRLQRCHPQGDGADATASQAAKAKAASARVQVLRSHCFANGQ